MTGGPHQEQDVYRPALRRVKVKGWDGKAKHGRKEPPPGSALRENEQGRLLQKKMQSPRDPAIPLLECTPKRPENLCQNKYLCTSVQHYSQQTKVEATQMSHQQMRGLSRTTEDESAIERNQVLITCYSMDEP